MNSSNFNIFASPGVPVDIFAATPTVDIFASPVSEEVNIFSTNSQSTGGLIGSIFASSTQSNVDIFSNNARIPADAVIPPLNIFSDQSSAEVDIFASQEEINIFSGDSEDISIFQTSEEVNIFNETSEESITSLFETLVSKLENEDLDNIASLVDVAKDLYTDGV